MFSLIVFAFNLKAKTYHQQLKQTQARTGTVASTAGTNAPSTRQPDISQNKTHEHMMLVKTASVTAAEPVAHGSVSQRIDCCCTFKNRKLYVASNDAVRIAPILIQRRYRASGYRRPCSLRVRSASRVGTRPTFSTAGRRRPLPQLDSASVLMLHLNC